MSKKTTTVLALAAVLVAGVPALAEEAYKVDAAHSHIGFTVRHFGISKVRGEFNSFDAELKVDESDLANSSVKVEIDTASIDTGNDQRDNHLRSDDFLNAEKYPRIVFESNSIREADGGFEAVGELTIRDQTREVVVPVEVAGPLTDPWGNVRLGIEGELEIDRQEYGVSWSQALDSGGLVVSDTVIISFSIEAMRPQQEEAEDSEESAEG